MIKRKYPFLLIITLLILILDQWTKYLVQKRLRLFQSVEVIEGFFNLVHVRNKGGAFGIFGGARGELFSSLFIVVSLIAIGVILYFFIKVEEKEKSLLFSLSLVLSGAIGNLIDRFIYGEVVDFLDFHLFSYHWPAFNIADSAITLGIGLIAFKLVFHDYKKTTKS
ncbi:MAG: signal peptidase II [Thermodesulfobacteriota bacterium]